MYETFETVFNTQQLLHAFLRSRGRCCVSCNKGFLATFTSQKGDHARERNHAHVMLFAKILNLPCMKICPPEWVFCVQFCGAQMCCFREQSTVCSYLVEMQVCQACDTFKEDAFKTGKDKIRRCNICYKKHLAKVENLYFTFSDMHILLN